jgi:hypothetical protein
MALLTTPFQAQAVTTILAATGTSGTMTFAASALGFQSARITNAGTAGATIFIQFINTANTTTVAITNAQPILAGQSAVLATGQLQAMGYISNSTTTVYVTPGVGGTGA